VVVFDHSGRLLRVLNVEGSSNLLLGLGFHRLTGHHVELLVIDFGAKNLLRVDPRTGASSLFTTIPGGAAAGPNSPVDSPWAAEVRRHTVARIPRRLPPVRGPHGDDD
jgi:hypothetical protein